MSLNWQSIRANPFALLTAPLLCVIVFLLSGYIYFMENKARTEPNDTTVISITSDQTSSDVVSSESADHRENDVRIIDTKQFKSHIETLLNASEKKDFKLKSELNILKREYKRKEYQQLLVIAARKASQNEQYDLSNMIFAEIGRKYFDDDLTGFFRAFSLDKVDDFRLAKRTYEWQLERYPNHQSSAINYGLLLLKMELEDEAIAALEHAINITSGKRKAKSLRFQARAYAKKHDNVNAVKSIHKSILFEPDKSQSWILLAELLSRDPEHSRQEVVDAHNKAIALSSKNYRPYYSLGSYYFSQLEFEHALKPLEKALTLAKQNHSVALTSAVNLYASGRPYSSQRVLKKILKEEGTDNTLHKVAYYLVEKKYEEARNELSEIKSIKNFKQSEFYGLHEYLRYEIMAKVEDKQQGFNSARTHLSDLKSSNRFYYPSILAGVQYSNALNANELALSNSEKLLEHLPKSAEVLLLHARTLVKNERSDEALQYYAQAHALQSESRRIGIDYVKLLSEKEKNRDALLIVERLLQSHPRYTRALLLKAKILSQLNKLNQAKEVLQLIITKDRNNVMAREVLSELHYRNGESELALSVINDLLSIESANTDARILKSIILINNKESSKALTELERVLKLDSNNVTALELKSKLLEKLKIKPESQVDG